MSKHNYSQYSDKKKASIQPKPNKPVETIDMPATKNPLVPNVKMELEPVQETVETATLPKTVNGVVVNCAKLNIREEPDAHADVVCVLDAMSEIVIDANKSDNVWLKVCTASGISGYCMRKFVDARL